MSSEHTIEIVGAGPAGLSAALAARANGAEVVVYEKKADVGTRFHGDFQGLENWTNGTDVLADLEQLGIETNFSHTAVYEIICFGPGGEPHTLRSHKPIFYLVRRGSDPGTLDHGLKKQALDSGVRIEFSSLKRNIPHGGVVAEGPHRADVIATGYVFETDMADGCYAVVADDLAPAGYSYLLVDQGRGTVATCLFEQFHDERHFLEETVMFFRREVGLRWHKAQRFGGSGNFQRVSSAVIGDRMYAGESAGFQDALFGFGLRYALLSGHLAGRAGRSSGVYERSWPVHLAGMSAASIFNRWLYVRLGDRGRRMVLRRLVAGRDPCRLLQRVYAPTWWKSSLARWLPDQQVLVSQDLKSGCDCTWCRCQRKGQNPGR